MSHTADKSLYPKLEELVRETTGIQEVYLDGVDEKIMDNSIQTTIEYSDGEGEPGALVFHKSLIRVILDDCD